MRWPWNRRDVDGEVRQAMLDAEEQEKAALDQTPEVDRKVRAAQALTKRSDRFARDIERVWRLRRMP